MRFQTYSLIIFFSFLNNFCQGQIDKSNYQLLWEVSGNGLEKPSYLFGTMHLKDKRVFEFSDSLLLKLDECDAFAVETHPDSSFLFYSKIFLKKDTTDFLKNILSPEAYERLNKKLKLQEGLTLDSLNNNNPFLIESYLHKDPPSNPDDKELKLDSYLYRIARRSGKNTFGLETELDRQDLVDLFLQGFEEEFSGFIPPLPQRDYQKIANPWLDTYMTGDLDLILQQINSDSSSAAHLKATLSSRNIVMADNFEKIAKQQSLFAAMGVAHLPGKEGVLELLRKKGFTLRPVTATFTGLSEKFKIKEKKRPWHSYQENYHKFQVDFPSRPYIWEYEKRGRFLLDHYAFYNDGVEQNKYFVKVSATYREPEIPMDSFMINSIRYSVLRSFDNQLDVKKITVNDLEGYEFTSKIDSTQYLKGQAFYTGSSIKFAVVRRKKNDFSHKDIDRFFKSFSVEKPQIYEWKKFESEEGAFSVFTPLTPDYTPMTVPAPTEEGNMVNLKLNIFTIKDFENGFLFLIRYNNLGEGRYLENDSLYLDTSMEDFKERLGEPDTIFKVEKNGYLGREIIFKKSDYLLRVQYYLRGNRTYLVLGQNLSASENDPKLDEFFDSFQFTPLNHSIFSHYESTENKFSIDFPKEPSKKIDLPFQNEYPIDTFFMEFAEDQNTGISYFVSRFGFSPYFQIDTVTSYLDEMIDSYNTYFDSVTTKKNIMIGKYPARYFRVKNINSENIFHYYITVVGDQGYLTYTIAPKEMEEKRILDFLNSFKINIENPSGNLTSKKIDKIREDFLSGDSTKFEKASNALIQHPLVESELPFIYEALSKEYPGDSIYYSSMIGMLCNQIIAVNDSNSVAELSKNFRKFPDNNIRKQHILNTLGKLNTTESLDSFIRLFVLYHPPAGILDYSLFNVLNPFRDSLEFLSTNYDLIIQKYQNDTLWGSPLSVVLNQFANQDSVDFSQLNNDVPFFIFKIKELVQKEQLLEKDSISNFSKIWELSNILELIGKLNVEKPDIKYLKKLLKIKHRDIVSTLITTLINLDQKVSKKYWKFIEEDHLEKHQLMYALHTDSLLFKVPKRWIDKDEIAKTTFYAYTLDNYYKLDYESIKLIKKFPFNYSKKDHIAAILALKKE